MQLQDVLQVTREAGLSWVWWRGLYEVLLRIGILERKFKHQSVDDLLCRSLGVNRDELDSMIIDKWRHCESHFFLKTELSDYARYIGDPEHVIAIADDALDGKILFFSRWQADLGSPPNWLLNPVNGVEHTTNLHWTRIPDLAEDIGDIKYVWEASRFPEAFYFVRAYALTGDEKYPEGFWRQFESWITSNPVELGPNWRCGQEIAIRSFAWLFALYAFMQSDATTEDRIALMLKSLWYNAYHIEKNHWYALKCVKNNHSLSEAAGLFTIGTMLPFFPESSRWRRKGFQNFCSEAMWQIYSDGTYVQHSTNYARLVLQLFTWCTQIAKFNGYEFPEKVNDRFRRLLYFLWSLQDRDTGRLPNYGSNDGALTFPLSCCDYLDYRPSLNALSEALDGKCIYEYGPWLEEARWFCGPEHKGPSSNTSTADVQAIIATIPEEKPAYVAFPEGGYYALRSNDLFAMTRCGEPRHRPGQPDMLHLDVWYKGCNILIDPGSYSYNPGKEWQGCFSSTRVHNTVNVDRRDQMKKGSRFLWVNWVRGKTLEFGSKGSACVFVGEHYGYSPVVHRRFIASQDNTLVVVDYLFGDTNEHQYTLHWLVNDLSILENEWGAMIDSKGDKILLRTGCSHEASASWVRADEKSKRGWQSPYYGERLPAWSYQMEVCTREPVLFLTMLKPMSENELPTSITHEEVNKLLQSWGIGSLDYVFEYSSPHYSK
jgi:hypothetical protein